MRAETTPAVPSAIPWPSLLALMYILFRTASLSDPGVPATAVLGSGVANLGYVLLVAGVLTGTFHILGLKGRGKVIGSGVAAVVVGIILSNL